MRASVLIAIAVTWSACQQEFKYRHYAEIGDDSLRSAIVKYVQTTSLDTKSRYVSIEYLYDGCQSAVLISAGISSESYRLSPPEHFGSIGDIVIVFSTTDGKLFEMDDIADEIDLFVKEKSITLKSELLLYDPPLWILRKNNNEYELIEHPDLSTFETFPCSP